VSKVKFSRKVLTGNGINPDAAEALRLAQEDARRNAEADAQRVLARHVCAKPCRKDYTLDIRTSRRGVVNKIGHGSNATYSVIVFAVWDMDVICVRVP
jgi:hypothetical protein